MVCFVTPGMHSIFILSTDYTDFIDLIICAICGFFNVSKGKPLHIKRYLMRIIVQTISAIKQTDSIPYVKIIFTSFGRAISIATSAVFRTAEGTGHEPWHPAFWAAAYTGL